MNAFANQNNIYINGTLISGVSALSTGNPVKLEGIGRLSVAIEGLSSANFTSTIQAIVHPSQTTWVNLLSTGFNGNAVSLYQIAGQFDALRVVINPYTSGTCNVWINGAQT